MQMFVFSLKIPPQYILYIEFYHIACYNNRQYCTKKCKFVRKVGIFMALIYQDRELMELMEDFYVLTGIRITLFDDNYNEMISYPKDKSAFCTYMRQNEKSNIKCRESDIIAFKECQKTKKLSIYKCHAGLIEAMAPVTEHGKIIGYLMFGQITDNKNRTEFIEDMIRVCKECDIGEDITGIIKRIKYRNNKQIQAASKIMDACTGYIQLKEMIHKEREKLYEEIDKFVDEHIGEEITVERLCEEFSISRTSLYEQMRGSIDGGIASYIRLQKYRYLK